MCGIAVVIRPNNGVLRDRSEAILLQMLGSIRHRGDAFHFAEREIFTGGAMGTNRLAIVDRDCAAQPVRDPRSGRRIVMNGEIYNHGELRATLIALGRKFWTWSDTEVVLQSFEQWGAACVDHLDGIFAFLIYDPVEAGYFAARDHLGIKPLYYARRGDDLMFASERKCFIGLTDDVHEVPPGHYMEAGRLTCYVAFAAEPVLDLSRSERRTRKI